jgi:cytochrome oxidase Cu insertion factor (SCO1/SenC/PrrC family)
MTERRKFLAGFTEALGAAAVAGAAVTATSASASDGRHSAHRLFSRDGLKGKSQFPEVTVETHEGKSVLLYDDLIRGKVVTVNFMSIGNEANYPITGRLAQMAALLNDQVGKDVHMVSITADPTNDTPERLAAFARKIGAPDGWTFVRISAEGSAMVAARLYRHGRRPTSNTKIDLVHYGNDAVGLWSAFPGTIQADDAAMRVASVMNGSRPTGAPRRAGPRRLGEPGPAFNNRIASA